MKKKLGNMYLRKIYNTVDHLQNYFWIRALFLELLTSHITPLPQFKTERVSFTIISPNTNEYDLPK
jgi:hypothetical protein